MFKRAEEVGRPAARACTSYTYILPIQMWCQTAEPPQIPLEVLKEMGGV